MYKVLITSSYKLEDVSLSLTRSRKKCLRGWRASVVWSITSSYKLEDVSSILTRSKGGGDVARYIMRKCMLYFYYLSISSLETYICTERQVVQNLKLALKLDEKIKSSNFGI